MSLGLHSVELQQMNFTFSCVLDSYITDYILASQGNISFTICGVKELRGGQFTRFTKPTLTFRHRASCI